MAERSYLDNNQANIDVYVILGELYGQSNGDTLMVWVLFERDPDYF
jgi:hypothetical protein